MAIAHIEMTALTFMGGAALTPRESRTWQNINSSASSQQTTITALAGEYAIVTSTGGAIYIRVGTNPTAVNGTGMRIADGQTRVFGPLALNDKIALID